MKVVLQFCKKLLKCTVPISLAKFPWYESEEEGQEEKEKAPNLGKEDLQSQWMN
jgi:hypothetical protein